MLTASRRGNGASTAIGMSEYGNPWWTYIVFQVLLIAFFSLLLPRIDVAGIAAMLDFKEMNTLAAVVGYLMQSFFPGMIELLFMVLVTFATSLLAFYTVRLEDIVRMFRFLLDWRLALWLSGSTAALYMLVPSDGVLFATWTSRIGYAAVSGASFYGLYRYMRQSASILFRVAVGMVSSLALAYSAYLVIGAAELVRMADFPQLIVLGLAMTNIALFNFGVAWLIFRLAGLFISLEYVSADTGKILLYCRLVMRQLADRAERTGMALHWQWLKDRFSE